MKKGTICNRGRARGGKAPHYGFIKPEEGGENMYFLIGHGRVLNQCGGFTEERETRLPEVGDLVYYSINPTRDRNYKGVMVGRWAFVPLKE